jgi:MFS family permease
LQLIRELGVTNGDEAKGEQEILRLFLLPWLAVGYYVGMIQSLFFATQAMTVLHWSRLSDIVGRKPVLLIGLFCLSSSMCCFGLSTTYWGLVIRFADLLRLTTLVLMGNTADVLMGP